MNFLEEWRFNQLSNLLNNPNLKKNKDPLDRGNDIVPQNTFKVSDLEESNPSDSIDLSAIDSKTDRITFYANVRINNHIKNKAEALSSIGMYKSQKEAIEEALDYLIDSLPSEEKRKLKFQIDTLEERDIRIKQQKK